MAESAVRRALVDWCLVCVRQGAGALFHGSAEARSHPGTNSLGGVSNQPGSVSRARWALQLQGVDVPHADEPFAAIIFATADRQKVDKRARGEASRSPA